MYFISNIFLRIRGGSKSSCTNAIFFALVQELVDRPSYINEQLLEHDAYISCLQLKKVNVAHDAMHNNYLYNHTAYYHMLQQVIAFLVIIVIIFIIRDSPKNSIIITKCSFDMSNSIHSIFFRQIDYLGIIGAL